MDGSKIITLGPNSGLARFATSVGSVVVSDSLASSFCCAFNDNANADKAQSSKIEDENRTNLSFMRTPVYDGYDLLQTIALIKTTAVPRFANHTNRAVAPDRMRHFP
jgi:hypothetical protein